MLVALVTYVKPLEEIDKFLPAHREFLAKHYAEKIFICSGGRKPRTGGVILARSVTPERLGEILREDPFYQNGLSTFEIVEFTPTMKLEGLEAFLD